MEIYRPRLSSAGDIQSTTFERPQETTPTKSAVNTLTQALDTSRSTTALSSKLHQDCETRSHVEFSTDVNSSKRLRSPVEAHPGHSDTAEADEESQNLGKRRKTPVNKKLSRAVGFENSHAILQAHKSTVQNVEAPGHPYGQFDTPIGTQLAYV